MSIDIESVSSSFMAMLWNNSQQTIKILNTSSIILKNVMNTTQIES